MLGFVFVAAYVMATAYSAVFVNLRFPGESAHLIAFTTFSACWLFFLAINRSRFAALLQVARAARVELLVVNVSTLFSWLGMFWCLKFVNASVQTLVYTAVIPLASMLLSHQWGSMRRSARLALLAILCTGILTAFANPSLTTSSMSIQLAGVGLALAAGACGAAYIVSSGELQRKHGLSAVDMLCMRFPLLVVVAGVLSLTELHRLADTGFVAKALLLSAMLLMLPSYLLQQSIMRIGGVRTAILLPLVPGVAMLLETREGFAFHPLAMTLLGLQCVAMMFVSWILVRHKQRAATAPASPAGRSTEVPLDSQRPA